jgi:ribosomal protein S18 acetylase RimI-like enzyme
MERCRPFLEADIAPLLDLAKREGWISGRREFEFLLNSYPQGCLVWQESGAVLGYLTSIRYGKSGWIGNLLVHPGARRQGVGRGLMERAVAALLKSGVETVWLTASQQGAGLYQKIGFVPIDSVQRWSGKGAPNQQQAPHPLEIEFVRAVDRVGWGDRRETLLQETCGLGRLHTSSGGFICCQEWEHGTQVGPWGCLVSAQAGRLFEQALSGGEGAVFLDVPAGNSAAQALLSQRGFTVQGSSLLMYLGERPLYQPGSIYALASMGSMG